MLKASVIIATHKRPDLIARCLDTLAPGMQTTSSSDYEVIVADDDPNRSAVGLLQEKYRWVKVVYGPSKGPSGARNTAAAFAKGELLIFTDDDVVPTCGWIEAYLNSWRPNTVMIGRTTCKDGLKDPFDHAPVNLDGAVRFGCNLALSREVFHDMGGFDEGFAKYGFEDYDFFTRCDQLGLTSVFVPEAEIDHPPRPAGKALNSLQNQMNHYRYLLKYGQHPRLTETLRVSIGFAKARLQYPAPFWRKIQYLGHVALGLLLTIAYYDRLVNQAKRSLQII